MSTVLAMVDADACAQPVLRAAQAIGALTGGATVALHVGERGAGACARLADAAAVPLRRRTGDPVEQIVGAASDPDADALVLGARGTHEGPRPAGSTALRIITEVGKPVVVVAPSSSPADRIRRVLVPLDGTTETTGALEGMLVLSEARELEILVLHVHTPQTVPPFSDHAPYAARAWEREFLNRYVAGASEQRVRLVRRFGTPTEHVVQAAHELGVDLIVLAWSRQLGPGRARVVSDTLGRSDIPVLLLPVRTNNRPDDLSEDDRPSVHPDPETVR